MKYVFILVLLLIAGAGGLLGAVVVYRWIHNMTHTAKIVPGERVFAMPASSRATSSARSRSSGFSRRSTSEAQSRPMATRTSRRARSSRSPASRSLPSR